jgi:hypothetical protein
MIVMLAPDLKTIPLLPPLDPFIVRPRSTTASLAPALMSTPSRPAAGTTPASTPAGLVIVSDRLGDVDWPEGRTVYGSYLATRVHDIDGYLKRFARRSECAWIPVAVFSALITN